MESITGIELESRVVKILWALGSERPVNTFAPATGRLCHCDLPPL